MDEEMIPVWNKMFILIKMKGISMFGLDAAFIMMQS